MIHVGFPLYDSRGTYSKYEAVAIMSLLSSTSSELMVHIIHDHSVSDDIKCKLKELCDRFKQSCVFHLVQADDFFELAPIAKSFTIGTLFRLKLPELIEESISKIIYLDADILVNTDIKPLWDENINDYYVAACHDDGLDINAAVLSDGLVPAEKYYNAGVVVFNLDKIRRDFNLFDESTEFLRNHPSCTMADQDAANYLFMDKVLYLEHKYNMFTKKKRGLKMPLEDGIYHYAADHVCLGEPEEFDKKYIEYMSSIKWDNNTGLDSFLWGYASKEHARSVALQSVCRWLSDKDNKIAVWGAGSTYLVKIFELVNLSSVSFFVDNNKKIQESIFYGRIVKSPEYLVKNGNVKVIVVSKDYYGEIKLQLESYGFVEHRDFVDGLLLLLQLQGGRVDTY